MNVTPGTPYNHMPSAKLGQETPAPARAEDVIRKGRTDWDSWE